MSKRMIFVTLFFGMLVCINNAEGMVGTTNTLKGLETVQGGGNPWDPRP